MRVLRRCFWMLCVLGLVLPYRIQGQTSGASAKTNRIIIYPGKGESVSQLKQRGISKVEDYGSFWVASATDQQAQEISSAFGDRANKADHLNRIELDAASLDTTKAERSIPSDLRQGDTAEASLRLIQFRGPVRPEWLEQVQAVGDLKIIGYVPHNAYLVWAGGGAVEKLRGLLDPKGPLQWIGPYHPYYKIQRGLLDAAARAPDGKVQVLVSLFDGSQGWDAENAIQGLGAVGSSMSLNGQKTFEMEVSASAISQLARIPEVLRIERVEPKQLFDEPQDLLLTAQTNRPPGHSPVPPGSGGLRYLDFLTNTVGGGLASFKNSASYPIVDVADTGLDTGGINVLHPVFYGLGNRGLPSRIAYLQPPNYAIGAEGLAFGCPRLNNNFAGRETGDILQHGTFVASIVAGYDDFPNTNMLCQILGVDGSGLPVVIDQFFPVAHLDNSAFQLGMGVSPFGPVGASRIFQQAVTVANQAGVCVATINTSFCLNSIVNLVGTVYGNGARIQNNSWGDGLNPDGLNGGVYGANSRTYDSLVRDALQVGGGGNVPGPSAFNQEFIAVFANGNAGTVANPGGFGDIRVTAPATAKNVISVGASENVRLDGSGCLATSLQDDSYDMSSFTSLGPCLDGRFKPEIVAPGSSIYGALDQLSYAVSGTCNNQNIVPAFPFYNNCLNASFPNPMYTCGSGTSFAAPAVSGAIQLLWWYFENRLTNELGLALFQPSPAMAKAYLCNSARYLPLTNPQTQQRDTLPSVAQGMGEMDLLRMFDGTPRVIRDESSQRALDVALFTGNPAPQQTFFSQVGQSYEVSGRVASNDLPFRVTVAWVDPLAANAAFLQLVNNLDLQVTIGGETYKGNVFIEDHSVPGGTYDGVNNMESVFLPAGGAVTSGAPYTVVVRAANIPGNGVGNAGNTNNQDFALVVYNSQDPTDVPNMATNNSCASAMAITQTPFNFTNTLSRALYGNVHPSPSAGRGGADEFFKIGLPTPGGVFTIDTAGSSFDSVLSVWRVPIVPQTAALRSECGALIEVASNNGGLAPSAVTFTADGSNNYFIVVEPHNDGTGGTMVLNVSASAPAIGLAPSPVLFPNTLVGLTSAVQAVSYQNGTAANIGITSVAITGSNAADFVIWSQSCAGNTLAPGQGCSVFVGFAPTTNGFRGAQLVITDDATGSPRIVPLSGNGLPPASVVCINGTSLSYGTITVGSTSAVQSVTITNCGSAALSLASRTISGLGAGDYIISSDTCGGGPVPASGTCTFNVGFAPAATGLRPATLTIVDNATNSPTVVTLTGSGQAPASQICLSRGSLTFGGQTAGSTSSVQSVAITNCGTALLHITSISLAGPNGGEFILSSDTCSGQDLAVSNSCTFGVSFAPTNAAAETASLVISNNSPANTVVVSLTGTGSGSQPNLWINKNRNLKKFIGKTALTPPQPISAQTLSLKGKKGKKVVFYVIFQNNGNLADSLIVQGGGDVAGVYSIRYFLGTDPQDNTDVTSIVEDGSFTTGSLAAGAFTGDTTMLRVEVTVNKTAPSSTNDVVITGSSFVDPSKMDVVRATVLVK